MIDRNSMPRSTFPPQAVAENVNELKQDLLTLVRLQWELLAADVRECMVRLRTPLVLTASAAVLALGAVPVLLFACAAALHALGVPLAWAQAIVGLIALAIAAGLTMLAWRRLRAAAAVMQRSRDELQRNIESLKELMMQDWSLRRGENSREGGKR